MYPLADDANIVPSGASHINFWFSVSPLIITIGGTIEVPIEVGRSKDNLESKEGAIGNEFLNTINQGRREEKLESNWTLQSRQSGSDRLQHNVNEGNMSKHDGRNANKGFLRYCASIGREQPKIFNWCKV